MIMEHGFIDNSADYAKLNSDAKLKKIGQVDATAIAEYFNLKKKSTVAYEKAADALESAQTTYDKAKAAYEEAVSQEADLTAQIDALDTELTQMQSAVDADTQAIDQLTALIGALDTTDESEDTQALLATYNEELEAAQAKLAEDNEALEAAKSHYDEVIGDLNSQLTDIKAQVDTLNNSYQKASKAYDKALATYNSSLSAYEADMALVDSFKYPTLAKPSVTIKNIASGINLSWNKVAYATSYKVYRSDSKNGTYKSIKSLSSSKLKYTDTSSTNGKTYYYKVYAYLESQKSVSSVKTMTRLTTPEITSCKNAAKKKIKVTWNENAQATGYVVRYVKGSATKTITITNHKTVTTTIKSLTKKKTYKVSIRSYKTVSGTKYYSAYSSAKSVKIKK